MATPCPDCNGTGTHGGQQIPIECTACWGTGHYQSRHPLAETCGRCDRPFDSTDNRFDGRSQHGDTPWCRSCVDRCHESTDFAHACPVCDPTRR